MIDRGWAEGTCSRWSNAVVPLGCPGLDLGWGARWSFQLFPTTMGFSHQGVVSRCKVDSIEVALPRYPEGERFRIDLTADEVTRRRQLAAINVVRETKGRLGHLRQISMGEVQPGVWDEARD